MMSKNHLPKSISQALQLLHSSLFREACIWCMIFGTTLEPEHDLHFFVNTRTFASIKPSFSYQIDFIYIPF